jgi:serine protease inhibitor
LYNLKRIGLVLDWIGLLVNWVSTLFTVTDEELKSQVISIPYQEDDMVMAIILPTTKPQKGAPPPVAEVVKKLTFAKLQKLVSEVHKQKETKVELIIPKFESEGSYDLSDVNNSLLY